MSQEELVENSTVLIRTIKKQGFMTKENTELIFHYMNLIYNTNEVVTYCTTCVENKLRLLVEWTKAKRPK
jgi:hypothetical protein